MRVRVVRAADVARVGAVHVASALAAASAHGRREPTLMAALGTSPLGVYAQLARRWAGGRETDDEAVAVAERERAEVATAARPAGLRLVQLDEYLGLAAGDPRLLLGWLRRDVAAPLGVAGRDVVALSSDAADLDHVCDAYDTAVSAAGGIDVAVLGLGPNGHLGFNEPPSGPAAPTRVVELAAESLASNARYWPGLAVPRAAITAGMSTVLAARDVLLVVTGEAKRDVLRRLLDDPIGPELPASFLRRHPAATLLVDEDAWPQDFQLVDAIT